MVKITDGGGVVTPKLEYRKVGEQEGWAIWQLHSDSTKKADFVANMKLEVERKAKSDTVPWEDVITDVQADISECMISDLRLWAPKNKGAYGGTIKNGAKPKLPIGSITPCAKPSIIRAKPTIRHG